MITFTVKATLFYDGACVFSLAPFWKAMVAPRDKYLRVGAELARHRAALTVVSKPIEDRTGEPVTQEIVGKRLQEELGSSDRTGKPVKCEDNRVMHVLDRTGKPVESSTHTQCKNLVLPDIVILHRQTRTSSTLQSMRKTSTSTSQACRTRW